VKLALARSKTDQEAAGQIVGVVATGTRPARWPRCRRGWWTPTTGAVFRAIDRHGRIATLLSDRAIALIVKRRAAAGVDPAGYSGDSLGQSLASRSGRDA
jgi:hypothetical protein